MDCNELLLLLTLGAVAPYLVEAASSWLTCQTKHKMGAHAPHGFRCRSTPAND